MKNRICKKAGLFLIFVFWAVLIYFNALRNPFHFDDVHHIQNNPAIIGVENIPSYFVDIRTFSIDHGNIGNYRPLLLMTHALNYWAGDLDPLGYHLVNLAFHIGSAFLIFLIVQAMLTSALIPLFPPLVKGDKGGLAGSSFAALAAGRIFLTTPFNSEVINYISARSSVMSAFFYLLAFYCWINYRSQKSEVRSQK
ncbi:MAG: hypothetical protein U0940_00735, partial [Nitrospirota bacterium]|nr:hypothetical protein [Nitrospirota bacterium]